MKTLLACAFTLALLLPGCATWTPAAAPGDEVLATVRVGGLSQSIAIPVQNGQSWGADVDAALVGAQAGDRIRADAVLMVRSERVTHDLLEQVPVGQLEAVLGHPPAVNETIDAGGESYTIVAIVDGIATVRGNVEPQSFEYRPLRSNVTISVEGDMEVITIRSQPGARFELGQPFPLLSLPPGIYMGLGNEGGKVRFARLDEPPAACRPGGAAVYAPTIQTVPTGQSATFSVLPCNLLGEPDWQWTLPPGFEGKASGTTVTWTPAEARGAPRLVASAGGSGQTVAFHLLSLDAGESDTLVPLAIDVLRVDAQEPQPEGDDYLPRRTTVREGGRGGPALTPTPALEAVDGDDHGH